MSESHSKIQSQYLIRACTPAEFDDVVALGDKYKASLGLMRYEAYREYLEAGTVFGAYLNEVLSAYALFALPRREIRLAHLVVDEAHRGHGVATLLVEAIRKKHSDLQGIVVRCRPDWEANAMWPRLGFVPLASVKGRAASGSELTSWRLNFGHDDLFSAQVEDTTALKVVLDTNIIIDLRLQRPGGEESQVLEAPWLAGEVLFCTTNGVHNEANQVPNQEDRKRVLSTVSNYANLYKIEHEALVRAKYEEWITGISASDLVRDPSLKKDCRLVAEAAIAGADVFVTRDRGAARVFDPLAASLGTRVLSPTELAVHVDELQRSVFYAPVQIQQTFVSISEAGAGSVDALDDLLNTAAGERRSAFRQRISESVRRDEDPTRRRRVIYVGDSSQPSAVLATRVHESSGTLVVPMFRIARGTMTQALALQLLYLLRSEARGMGLPHIQITDPSIGPDPRVQESFKRDGLWQTSSGWSMLAIESCASWSELQQTALAAADMAQLSSASFDELLKTDVLRNPQAAAEVERLLWPAKVTDGALPTYIVPIRPHAASQLLGHDLTLFGRPTDLGLSRRHVYYKSRNYVPRAPGRILWYVSSDKLILGSSRLVSTRVGTPSNLYSRYKTFGVWNIQDVQQSADSQGLAAALIFADTEIFDKPINYHRAVDLAAGVGIPLGTLPGARAVPAALFDQIYREGTRCEAAAVG
jgi:GNAT superfamily N-acetyltransferase/predicted nucleic acid-binding protein